MFTVDEARALIPEVRERTKQIVRVRAELAELTHALRGGAVPDGSVAEAKAHEARLDEWVSWFGEQGIAVRGLAPMLIDFPAVIDGEPMQLCWLEGERELAWCHRPDLGFVGRRPLQ